MDEYESMRRLKPRVYDTDWLMLRGMAKEFRRLVAEYVEPGHHVLDFGCGDMPYRPIIEARGATYVGADFGHGADLEIGSNGFLPTPDSSVDVVLSLQVLEHVREIDTYFAEIARVLKPDGLLILSTHGSWLYHPHPEDHRRWTRMGLVHDIEAHEFDVKEVEAIVGPLGTTTMIRLTGYAHFLRRIPAVGKIFAGAISIIMNLRALVEESVTPNNIRTDNGCVYMTISSKKAPA